jgi:DNA-binding Lrp family transcriptional regulator
MDSEALDRTDRAIVNAFQGGFPVVAEPFEPAAARLREHDIDVTAAELQARISDLDEAGVLSRFGPLVNAERIGGTATLVAMPVPDERFEAVTEQVNAHREVAHNYERAHPELTMWFVVSVADEERVDEVLGEIEAETGLPTYNLPKQREFRVRATFPVEGPLTAVDVDCSDCGPAPDPDTEASLTPAERDLIVAVQDGLPTTATPYADVAAAIGQETDWVVAAINRFRDAGKIRRVGVVPNHYALGYSENGMTVWNVPDDAVGDIGRALSALPFVTHCYERPRHEGVWPYNLFAMTHGRTEAESERRIAEVRSVVADHCAIDDEDWDTLFSTRILKKTGIRLDERAAANTVE